MEWAANLFLQVKLHVDLMWRDTQFSHLSRVLRRVPERGPPFRSASSLHAVAESSEITQEVFTVRS